MRVGRSLARSSSQTDYSCGSCATLKGRATAYYVKSCSILTVFASSPLRGEDNDGNAQQCHCEVGVISERLDKGPEVTPTAHGKIDFCEVQKSSRTVLPPQGGGGAKSRQYACGEIICDSPALKGEGGKNERVELIDHQEAPLCRSR
jgi:hypothetical protein